jgi:hypothetical protein
MPDEHTYPTAWEHLLADLFDPEKMRQQERKPRNRKKERQERRRLRRESTSWRVLLGRDPFRGVDRPPRRSRKGCRVRRRRMA